ncbi:hypothetical protein L1285_13075 [Pseudoalteromonas sp. DL2-H2.2]|nr:hypothetical protein [Pseudoalteromonas sp. DL2-H2.2]MCF2909254.1 hypothetical protein [Pseudoalteromonas sp. DL2-H2.2]
MKKAKQFTPKTIEELQLKDVTGGGIGDRFADGRPVFIGYHEPIENIKF